MLFEDHMNRRPAKTEASILRMPGPSTPRLTSYPQSAPNRQQNTDNMNYIRTYVISPVLASLVSITSILHADVPNFAAVGETTLTDPNGNRLRGTALFLRDPADVARYGNATANSTAKLDFDANVGLMNFNVVRLCCRVGDHTAITQRGLKYGAFASGENAAYFANAVTNVVNWANAKNVYVIVTLHTVTGPAFDANGAAGQGGENHRKVVEFWKDLINLPVFANSRNVIFELMNEPEGTPVNQDNLGLMVKKLHGIIHAKHPGFPIICFTTAKVGGIDDGRAITKSGLTFNNTSKAIIGFHAYSDGAFTASALASEWKLATTGILASLPVIATEMESENGADQTMYWNLLAANIRLAEGRDRTADSHKRPISWVGWKPDLNVEAAFPYRVSFGHVNDATIRSKYRSELNDRGANWWSGSPLPVTPP